MKIPRCARRRSGGRLEVIELLLARGASADLPGHAGMTPLIEASLEANPAAVRRLLAAGADVKAKDADGWAALHRNFGGGSSMNVEVVALLIDAGADVNVQEGVFGCTPLHLVAERGSSAAPGVAAAIIERLIRAGADMTIKDRISGWTPFVRAVAHGDVSMVKAMIALGADMKEIEGGKGAELAEKWGDPAVAQYLRSLG
jgi:ankyrin repeat protein